MELLGRIGMLCLVFENENTLALIKGKVECLLPMGFNENALDVFKRQIDKSLERGKSNALVDLSNRQQLLVDEGCLNQSLEFLVIFVKTLDQLQPLAQ